MCVRFEWDEAKNRSNFRKHGVDFETATSVFDDPHQDVTFDRVVDGEERWHTVGVAESKYLLLVIHTYWTTEGEEVFRIISARYANARERKRYGNDYLSA